MARPARNAAPHPCLDSLWQAASPVSPNFPAKQTSVLESATLEESPHLLLDRSRTTTPWAQRFEQLHDLPVASVMGLCGNLISRAGLT
jgi:hypothetical protein